jgi:hypothetical protein
LRLATGGFKMSIVDQWKNDLNKLSSEDGLKNCCGMIILLPVLFIIGYLLLFLLIPTLIVSAIVITCFVLFNYSKILNLFFKQQLPGAIDQPIGDQPAYKQYFFRKAFIDLKTIITENLRINKTSILEIYNKIKQHLFVEDSKRYIYRPIGYAIICAIPVAAIIGGAAFIGVTAIHTLIVAFSAGIIIVTAMVFRGVESVNMARWQIFFACPHCYKKFSLPTYSCTNCGAKHTMLVPGQYGIFKRKCQCGNFLPTLFFNGKNTLPGECPHCHSLLSQDIGVAINVHYPIVGGGSAGKSTFLVASMLELEKQSKQGGFTLSLSEKSDIQAIEKARDSFSKGIILDKTTTYKPKAFLAKLQKDGSKKQPPYLIYMYDAAGEIFEDGERLHQHVYFEYINGIFFLIDPFSLPVVHQEFEQELVKAGERIKTSREQPKDVFDRMVNHLKQHKELKKQKDRYTIPIAVVVTKTDAFGLESKISQVPEQKGKSPEEVSSEKIRSWLINNGEGNLVRSIENMFASVQYFSCSAFGHVPDEKSPEAFIPKKVWAPINWIFSYRKILQ